MSEEVSACVAAAAEDDHATSHRSPPAAASSAARRCDRQHRQRQVAERGAGEQRQVRSDQRLDRGREQERQRSAPRRTPAIAPVGGGEPGAQQRGARGARRAITLKRSARSAALAPAGHPAPDSRPARRAKPAARAGPLTDRLGQRPAACRLSSFLPAERPAALDDLADLADHAAQQAADAADGADRIERRGAVWRGGERAARDARASTPTQVLSGPPSSRRRPEVLEEVDQAGRGADDQRRRPRDQRRHASARGVVVVVRVRGERPDPRADERAEQRDGQRPRLGAVDQLLQDVAARQALRVGVRGDRAEEESAPSMPDLLV